ncbi:MAG: MFS transporter [Phycisphaerales bacterium]|nr:MFS transporter [Phycisphaerales bacterium]
MLGQYLKLPRAVHILCVGSFINRAGSFFVAFMSLYLTTVLNLDERFATLNMGLFGVGSIAAVLIGGHFADHLGRKRVMLLSLFAGAATLLAFSFARTQGVVMCLTVVAALLAEMYRPAASALIADLTQPHERPIAFSLMYVSINLGFAVGATVGGMLAEVNFRALFWLDAATSAIYGLIILTTIKETLRRAPTTRPATQRSGGGGSDPPGCGTTDDSGALAAQQAAVVPLAQAALRILRDSPFLLFCLGVHLNAYVFMQSMSTLPLYMKHRGIEPAQYGLVVALNGVLIVFGQLPLAALVGRFDRGSVIALGALLTAVGFGLIAWAQTMLHYALTVVVWTAGEMLMATSMSAVVADLAPADMRARYMGVFTMSFSSAMMISAPLGGWVLAHPVVGGRGLWGMAFLVGMVSTSVFLVLRTRIAKHPVVSSA